MIEPASEELPASGDPCKPPPPTSELCNHSLPHHHALAPPDSSQVHYLPYFTINCSNPCFFKENATYNLYCNKQIIFQQLKSNGVSNAIKIKLIIVYMQRKLGQALILCMHIELLKRSICILQETRKEHSELSVFTLVPLERLSVHTNPSDVPLPWSTQLQA